MTTTRQARTFVSMLALSSALNAGCTRAPTFDILGSYFPAWLVCLAAGILLTACTHWALLRLQIPIALPIVAYPSLTASFTFALWLVFFP